MPQLHVHLRVWTAKRIGTGPAIGLGTPPVNPASRAMARAMVMDVTMPASLLSKTGRIQLTRCATMFVYYRHQIRFEFASAIAARLSEKMRFTISTIFVTSKG